MMYLHFLRGLSRVVTVAALLAGAWVAMADADSEVVDALGRRMPTGETT